MTVGKTNFERLHDAGVIDATKFSPEDKAKIGNITNQETDTLINMRKKMGTVPAGKPHMQPNMVV